MRLKLVTFDAYQGVVYTIAFAQKIKFKSYD